MCFSVRKLDKYVIVLGCMFWLESFSENMYIIVVEVGQSGDYFEYLVSI